MIILQQFSSNPACHMNKLKTSIIWFYLLFLPSVLTLLGLGFVFAAVTFEWGSEAKIPVAMLSGLFFAELIMVVAALGIVAFIKSTPKTSFLKVIGIWDTVILITAGITGYKIFMSL